MKKFTFFLISIGIIMSCVSEDAEEVVTVNNKYSLSIPSFLTEVRNLNEDASLQYQHAWKEFYVIVIDEAKSDYDAALKTYNLSSSYSQDLSGYTNLVLENFSQIDKSDIQDITVNNLPAKTLTVKEHIDGIDIYYAIAIVEGKENYYQIMTWTLANKQYQYQDKMSEILYSFNEF